MVTGTVSVKGKLVFEAAGVREAGSVCGLVQALKKIAKIKRSKTQKQIFMGESSLLTFIRDKGKRS